MFADTEAEKKEKEECMVEDSVEENGKVKDEEIAASWTIPPFIMTR